MLVWSFCPNIYIYRHFLQLTVRAKDLGSPQKFSLIPATVRVNVIRNNCPVIQAHAGSVGIDQSSTVTDFFDFDAVDPDNSVSLSKNFLYF